MYQIYNTQNAYETNFISCERSFKVVKNGVYFIVIAFLVAELFKILIYANYMTGDVTMWTQSGVLSHKKNKSLSRLFLKELKPSTVVTLITKFRDMSTVTFPTATHGNPRQHNGLPLHSNGKTFPPVRRVICSCCSLSGCERIWTLHSTSIRKSVKLWSNK